MSIAQLAILTFENRGVRIYTDCQRFVFMKRLRGLLVGIALVVQVLLATSGLAYAQQPVSLVLNSPKYCTISPPTTTQCSDLGSLSTDNTGAIYVTASYDTAHLSVSYYCSTPALAPESTNNCNPTNWQDNVFHLSTTYVKQTCDVGTYTIWFTATQGSDVSRDSFTVYVHCPFVNP